MSARIMVVLMVALVSIVASVAHADVFSMPTGLTSLQFLHGDAFNF